MEQLAFMVRVMGISQAKEIMIESMRARRQIDILYVRANGSTTIRTVEPFGFAYNNDQAPYVRSMDHKTGEPRTWRLDRIIGYRLSKNPFALKAPESSERWTGPAYASSRS